MRRSLCFSMPVVGIIAFLLAGCGGETPPPAPPSPSPAAPQPGAQGPKLEQSDLHSATESDVDFASLEKFPDLKFQAAGTLPDSGDPKVVLMDGANVASASGQAVAYWSAKTPASFEITIPNEKGHIHIDHVEIQDAGGDKAIGLCSVSIMPEGKDTWQPPEGITKRMKQVPVPGGMAVRHIIEFDEAHATAVRVNFMAGPPAHPEQVFVSDIDIIGELEH